MTFPYSKAKQVYDGLRLKLLNELNFRQDDDVPTWYRNQDHHQEVGHWTVELNLIAAPRSSKRARIVWVVRRHEAGGRSNEGKSYYRGDDSDALRDLLGRLFTL